MCYLKQSRYIFLAGLLRFMNGAVQNQMPPISTQKARNSLPAIIQLLAFLIILPFSAIFALAPEYHGPDEIYEELIRLQDNFPEWIAIDSIGHSSEFELPIWMAKISDFPSESEPEPALLFIGQIHADEVEGVEVTLALMNTLLENLEDDEFRNRVENAELYFIPTLNPEGLEVVHSELDLTFRKNCRDNVGDGEFRFQDRVGWDSSGVDLNRNFPLHWNRGQDLYERANEFAVFNYYRGPYPGSEPEIQALIKLARDKRFQFSICYHSSRSQVNSQSVLAPYYWGPGKEPPDLNAIETLGNALALRIPNQNRQGSYDPRHTTQRNGQSPDWFYQAIGTYHYIVEIGEGIQPEWEIMEQLIEDQLVAAWYLIDLGIGHNRMNGFGTLTVLATDAVTGSPIEARIDVDVFNNPILEPRKTSIETGRFDWLMPEGYYNVAVSAFGYNTLAFDSLEIITGQRTSLEIELEPYDQVQVEFNIRDSENGNPIDAVLRIEDELAGGFELNIPAGGGCYKLPLASHNIQIFSSGYIPRIFEIDVQQEQFFSYGLAQYDVLYEEDFDADQGWEHGGPGGHWGVVEQDGRMALTESNDGEYLPETAAWLLIETGAEIADEHNAALMMIHRPYFEPGADSGYVKIWNNNSREWINAATYSQFPDGWDTTYIQLSEYGPGEIRLQFRVTSDRWLDEDGWLIDKLQIWHSELPQEVFAQSFLPNSAEMAIYPNPTNGSARLTANFPVSGYGSIQIYDMTGRHVRSIFDNRINAGLHEFAIDGSQFPTGMYMVKLNGEHGTQISPLMFIK